MEHSLVEPILDKDEFLSKIITISWTTGTEEDSIWISNGTSYIHLDIIDDKVHGFYKYGLQFTYSSMIHTISKMLKVEIISEHDSRYWDMCKSRYGEPGDGEL